MPKRNIIGEKVKLARGKAVPKITQTDLAARLQIQGLQIERTTISKIETGYREVKDIELVNLAKALDVSAAWLLGECDDTSR